MDNPYGIGTASGESVNGYGYGDGIADNERIGMSNSMFFNLGGGSSGTPSTLTNYFNVMKSVWNDGSHVTYGGGGHLSSAIESKYFFPGGDDVLFGGTGGTDPGADWSETLEGHPVGDRRGIGSSGSFDFLDGDTVFFDIAYVTGVESTSGGYSSHEALQVNVDSARNYFHDNATSCGQDFDFYEPFTGTFPGVGIDEVATSKVKLYPNPSKGIVNISNLKLNSALYVHDMSGNLIMSQIVNSGNIQLNMKNQRNGIYLITVESEERIEHLRWVKQ